LSLHANAETGGADTGAIGQSLSRYLPAGSQVRKLSPRTKPPEQEGDEFDEELELLPREAREVIESFVGNDELLRLQLEIEWGQHPVHAAKWKGLHGVQEIKVFDDGRILFVELPSSEPIPDSIRELAAGASVEALLLQVWAVIDIADPTRHELYLTTGDPLEAISIARSHQDAGSEPD
jgi:hypothetical protein